MAEVSALLNIAPEEVRERARQGLLLAYRGSSGELRYPRAQFTEEGIIDGLEEVLDAMHVQDPWMRLQLFCDRDVCGALEDGRIEDAVRAADSYLPSDEG